MIITCTGQTIVPGGGYVDDPKPNCLGLEGEVTALPYVVPPGKKLILSAYGIEGTDGPTTSIFPWIGDDFPPDCDTDAEKSAYRLPRALMTCASAGGSDELVGVKFILLEGMRLHFKITNAPHLQKALAWYWNGELEDA